MKYIMVSIPGRYNLFVSPPECFKLTRWEGSATQTDTQGETKSNQGKETSIINVQDANPGNEHTKTESS